PRQTGTGYRPAVPARHGPPPRRAAARQSPRLPLHRRRARWTKPPEDGRCRADPSPCASAPRGPRGRSAPRHRNGWSAAPWCHLGGGAPPVPESFSRGRMRVSRPRLVAAAVIGLAVALLLASSRERADGNGHAGDVQFGLASYYGP